MGTTPTERFIKIRVRRTFKQEAGKRSGAFDLKATGGILLSDLNRGQSEPDVRVFVKPKAIESREASKPMKHKTKEKGTIPPKRVSIREESLL